MLHSTDWTLQEKGVIIAIHSHIFLKTLLHFFEKMKGARLYGKKTPRALNSLKKGALFFVFLRKETHSQIPKIPKRAPVKNATASHPLWQR